jgi:hypothetical protein
MTPILDLAAALAGLLLVLWVLWDVFQTVIVPRPTPARYRLARYLAASTWPIWRRRALRLPAGDRRERFLGTYAPLYVVVLLGLWVTVLVVGYGLVLWAVRDQLDPIPASLGDAAYAAGVSLLTIGFGDLVPVGPIARIVELLAAGTGLGVVALTITYLFSLFAAFQRREMLVTTLDARAGAPPSGIALLETFARTGMLDRLDDLLRDWETWCAEVLDSHVAYPVLCYFRSSHDNESWVGAVGAILDASTLVLTTIEGLPRGQAEMTHRIGDHLVEDIASFFGHEPADDPGVDGAEFDEARRRLAAAGFELRERDLSWALFVGLRSRYATRLNSLADRWLTPPAQWIGARDHEHHS